MSNQDPPAKLSKEDAKALIKAIEEVEREEAEQQARQQQDQTRKSA
ncbi:MAG: hypothetical protein AAGF97_08425 [Planctomycetota bacterium]